MSSRTAAEAVRLHLAKTQRLVSCVTSGVVRVFARPGSQQVRTASFAGGSADLAGVRLKLELSEHFRAFELGGQHTLIVVGYQYAILDAAEQEIVAYHWHPLGRSRYTQPHLHLGQAAQVRQRDLAAAHLPTSIISLADVIEFAIAGFDVVPRTQDWRGVIAEVRASR